MRKIEGIYLFISPEICGKWWVREINGTARIFQEGSTLKVSQGPQESERMPRSEFTQSAQGLRRFLAGPDNPGWDAAFLADPVGQMAAFQAEYGSLEANQQHQKALQNDGYRFIDIGASVGPEENRFALLSIKPMDCLKGLIDWPSSRYFNLGEKVKDAEEIAPGLWYCSH